MPTRSSTKQTPLLLVTGIVALLFAFGGQAYACAVCLKGITITPGQKLDSADKAVLALPLANPGQFHIVEVIKGDVTAGATITQPGLSATKSDLVMSMDGPLASQEVSQASTKKPLLLVRDKLSEGWASIGAIDAGYAGWLRELAATGHGGKGRPTGTPALAALVGANSTNVEWLGRVAVVAPQLESTEPLAAEIAYGELARAPYDAIRTLKPQLDAAKIATWVDDQKLEARLPAYVLLLGIVGGPGAAKEIDRRIGSSLDKGETANLSAVLAADLELRGPSRVDWLEQTFFADRRRTLPEIEAALLALSVHGGADTAVWRARVVQAYRYFINARKPMAGFVAMELANWGAWEVTADYVEIMRSKAVKDPAGEFAILSYLHESPATAAVAASQSSPGRQE
ncbi:MAG TPA: hypothetical protein VNS34_00020 [Rhizobiaceae bacterium]|nr:hypothetical protein [Rhizobiaceae bacterium]